MLLQIAWKSKSLLKKNQLKSFYTINGKLKIKYDSGSGEVSAVITHDEDFLMTSRVEREHNPRR